MTLERPGSCTETLERHSLLRAGCRGLLTSSSCAGAAYRDFIAV